MKKKFNYRSLVRKVALLTIVGVFPGLASCAQEELWVADTYVVVEGTMPDLPAFDSDTLIPLYTTVDYTGNVPDLGRVVRIPNSSYVALSYTNEGRSFSNTVHSRSSGDDWAFSEDDYILWAAIDVDRDGVLSSGDYYYPYVNGRAQVISFTISNNEKTYITIDNDKFGVIP